MKILSELWSHLARLRDNVGRLADATGILADSTESVAEQVQHGLDHDTIEVQVLPPAKPKRKAVAK